jgi:hypothetical protein
VFSSLYSVLLWVEWVEISCSDWSSSLTAMVNLFGGSNVIVMEQRVADEFCGGLVDKNSREDRRYDV